MTNAELGREVLRRYGGIVVWAPKASVTDAHGVTRDGGWTVALETPDNWTEVGTGADCREALLNALARAPTSSRSP